MRYFLILIFTLFLMTSASSKEEIDLSSLTLKQKIAQMLIVSGDKYDSRFTELGVGGIFLGKQTTKEDKAKQ